MKNISSSLFPSFPPDAVNSPLKAFAKTPRPPNSSSSATVVNSLQKLQQEIDQIMREKIALNQQRRQAEMRQVCPPCLLLPFLILF